MSIDFGRKPKTKVNMPIDLEELKERIKLEPNGRGKYLLTELIEGIQEAKEIIEWARPLQDAEPYAQPSIPKCKSWLHKFFPTQTKDEGFLES